MFVAPWSGGYTSVRLALDDCPPLLLLAVRYMGVLLLLIAAYIYMQAPLPNSRRDWANLAIVGLLFQGIFFALANIAVKLGVSAAGLGIVLALQPILIALAVPRFAGEAVGQRIWLGLVLGLSGAIIVLHAKSSIGGATTSGIVTAIIALQFITGGTLWEKRFGTSQHPIVANLVLCCVAGVVALEPFHIHWTRTFASSLAYLVIGNSIVAMTLLLAMIRQGHATRASALLFLVPPGSVLIAWGILGEPLSAWVWLGMLIAGLGVWLVRN